MFLKLSSAYTVLSLSIFSLSSIYASDKQEELQRNHSYVRIPYFFNENKDPTSPLHFSSLKPYEKLQRAQELLKSRKINGFDCLAFLINDEKALGAFRDRAIIEYGTKIIYYLSQNITSEQIITFKTKSNSIISALEILVDNQAASEKDRIDAISVLFCFYSPNMNYKKFYPNALEAKKILKKGLSFVTDANQKAHLLREIAILYENGFLKNQNNTYGHNIKAFKYYQKIDSDENIPLTIRLQSKLNQLYNLQNFPVSENIFNEKAKLINDIISNIDTPPHIYKEAFILYFDIKYNIYVKSNENFSEILMLLNQLKVFMSDSTLEPDVRYLCMLGYTSCLIDLTRLGKQSLNDLTDVPKLLTEIVEDNHSYKIEPYNFIRCVINLGHVASLTYSRNFAIFKKYNLESLIEKALKTPEITAENIYSIQYLETLLKIQGLIPLKAPTFKGKAQEMRTQLKCLLNILTEPRLEQTAKLTGIRVLAQRLSQEEKGNKLFLHYNNDIGKLIKYLKDFLPKIENASQKYEVQYILYLYFNAFKEAPIEPEEAFDYAHALSQPEVPQKYRLSGDLIPKALRISSLQDEEKSSSSEDQVKTGSDIEEDLPSTLELKDISLVSSKIDSEDSTVSIVPEPPVEILPLLSESMTTEKEESEEAISLPALSLPLPLEPKPPRSRVLKRSLKVIKRLESNRGKVSMQEVVNMFRQLEDEFQFKIQSTQEHTLTLHPRHKKGGNKKGDKNLSAAQKKDILKVAKTAVEKIQETPEEQPLKQSQTKKEPIQKRRKKT